jgi:hypothetical protein
MCELTARHGRGTAWARHAVCESAFKPFYTENTVTYLRISLLLFNDTGYRVIRGSKAAGAWC